MDGCLSASKSPLGLWIKGCPACLLLPPAMPWEERRLLLLLLFGLLSFCSYKHPPALPCPCVRFSLRHFTSRGFRVLSRKLWLFYRSRVYMSGLWKKSYLHEPLKRNVCTFLLFCFVTQNASPWVLPSRGNPAHRMSLDQIKAPEEQRRRDPFHPSGHCKIYGLYVKVWNRCSYTMGILNKVECGFFSKG